MEDVMQYARQEVKKLSFQITPSDILLPQALSDNIVAYATKSRHGLAIMRIFKVALWRVARCLTKVGSLAIINASVPRYDRSAVDLPGMELRLEFEEPLLGVVLSATGSSVG